MRGGGLEWLRFFRGLPQPHIFEIPFHVSFGFYKTEGQRESYFILLLKHNDRRNQTQCFDFGLLYRIHPNGCKFDLN